MKGKRIMQSQQYTQIYLVEERCRMPQTLLAHCKNMYKIDEGLFSLDVFSIRITVHNGILFTIIFIHELNVKIKTTHKVPRVTRNDFDTDNVRHPR